MNTQQEQFAKSCEETKAAYDSGLITQEEALNNLLLLFYTYREYL